jgi:hypothetical protein
MKSIITIVASVIFIFFPRVILCTFDVIRVNIISLILARQLELFAVFQIDKAVTLSIKIDFFCLQFTHHCSLLPLFQSV